MIPKEEKDKYLAFARELTNELGAITNPKDPLLWHYTSGSALISIIESGAIYSTQLSGLNDTMEFRYAAYLFREALLSLQASHNGEATATFIENAISYFREDPDFPMQHVAHSFVTCFSEIKDDLNQWRAYGGGENGYAIGFKVSELWKVKNGILARVNYHPERHKELALKAANRMVEFFLDGIEKFARSGSPRLDREFLEAWNSAIVMVAPLVKHPAFCGEREYRIVKGYSQDDLKSLRFIQKNNLMARHLPLKPGAFDEDASHRLPISEVMVGPSRHRQISRISVDTLLKKHGYYAASVSISNIPFQIP